MTLTDEDIEIIQKARARLEGADWYGYICISIEGALLSHFDVESLDESFKAKRIHQRLTAEITESLDYHPTLFIYLRREVPGLQGMAKSYQDDVLALARMAWLDKMIESRRIA